jgi:hypothetical protein
MRSGAKLGLVAAGLALAGVLIGFYVSHLTVLAGSASYTVPVKQVNGKPVVEMKLMTVAAIGPKLSPNPDWVSYLIMDRQGQWKRETVWQLPANATVHVTIYNFDGDSGLRNPYFGRPQGVSGNAVRIDGKRVDALDPDHTSHTFAIPQYGLVVPVAGVDDNAKNQCGFAPCPMSTAHRTISFTFHTGARGKVRWQCFVPCAAGWIDGFGGPMQTIGYMDGYINVV